MLSITKKYFTQFNFLIIDLQNNWRNHENESYKFNYMDVKNRVKLNKCFCLDESPNWNTEDGNY